MVRLLSWPRAGLNAISQLLIGLRPTVRRLVPRRLHHVAGHAVRWFIRAVEQGGGDGAGLGAFKLTSGPLLEASAFESGPILHVNTALAWGGAERQLVNILQRIPARVARPVGLICLRLGESPEFDFFCPELANTKVAPRNAMREEDAADALDRLGGSALRREFDQGLAWAPKDFRSDILRFAAEFATARPRAVHGWQDAVGLAAAFAALAVGVPRVIIACRNVRPANFSYYRPFMLQAYRLLAAEPRVLICNNSEIGARDYAAWLGIDPARIRVVRNGIDADRIRRASDADVQAFRTRLGVPQGAPLIGSLFRLFAEKRPLLWVQAAAVITQRVPDAHFAVFGTGAMEAQFLRAARRRGIADRIKLMPATNAIGLALSAFDAFLLTSRYEGTPNVVLEAGLVGAPVVAMDAGGVAETVREGVTGYVIRDDPSLGDEERAGLIADRVAAVLDDPAWCSKVREAAPAFVRASYGMERMIAETLSLYNLGDDAGRQPG